MKLHNKINRQALKEALQESQEERLTLSFYQYAQIQDPEKFRDDLFLMWDKLKVWGRTYVAKEGINAQISMPKANFEAFKTDLYSIDFLKGCRLNIAVDDDGKSFYKLTIKVRDKIVADGLNDETFDVTNKGVHLDAERFNELTDQEETILIDMRNHYETEVGHFENAMLPDVDTFREALEVVKQEIAPHKDKPIVMYCTGGIRCEKASAYFKHAGFEKVYQLEGGIIEYTRQVREKGLKNKFIGKNFVFDERLGERISDEVISHCHQCGKPCDSHTNCKNEACHLLFIQCEECAAKYNACCSEACQEFVALPEETRKELRKGIKSGQNIFRKGRFEENAGKFAERLPKLQENQQTTPS